MHILDAPIGFIGAGNMAEAMIGALIGSRTVDSANVMACDINAERLETLKRSYNIRITSDAGQLFESSHVVILAVKPQVMNQVLENLASLPVFRDINERKLMISIAAGITISRLETFLYGSLDETARGNLPIVRVMPNTPSLVLTGMAGFCLNQVADQHDALTTQIILESMGRALSVPEEHMDAVTAMSGSGPAYFFYMIEAMVEKGIGMGLSQADALTLSVQTMKGAAQLLEKTNEAPEQLRKKVTSPGGTTEAALRSLEMSGFKSMIGQALEKAATRSKELSS